MLFSNRWRLQSLATTTINRSLIGAAYDRQTRSLPVCFASTAFGIASVGLVFLVLDLPAQSNSDVRSTCKDLSHPPARFQASEAPLTCWCIRWVWFHPLSSQSTRKAGTRFEYGWSRQTSVLGCWPTCGSTKTNETQCRTRWTHQLNNAREQLRWRRCQTCWVATSSCAGSKDFLAYLRVQRETKKVGQQLSIAQHTSNLHSVMKKLSSVNATVWPENM